MHLTILHTNDLHGHVPELLRIASLVRQIRAEVARQGGYSLYLDAGDCEDTSLLESSLTKGSAMEAILRGAGCDQVALGNAIPIRYGPEAISNLAKYFSRPLLCGNLFEKSGKLVEGLQPFILETFGADKVGILGVTDPIKTYETIFDLIAKDPVELLPAAIQELRALGAKTIMLLSHLGLKGDRRAAEAVSGIDLIIGGHSHTKLEEPLLINETLIAQAGEFGKCLGRLDLEIDPATGKIVHYQETLLPVTEDIPFDAETQSAVERQQARVDQMMTLEIGTLNEPLSLTSDSECAAGNLLADALLDRVPEAQIALVLAGHWNTGLGAGQVTQGTLYAANRSTANPAKVKLTGEQIETFLREAFKPENAARQMHALRGKPVGFPHVAGITVRFDPEDLNYLEISLGGKTLQKDGNYIVVSTDMEFSAYINYLVIPDDQVEYEIPTIIPEVLEDYMRAHSPVPTPHGRRIIPK